MANLTATRRLRETWDSKLRLSEREFFCYLASIDLVLADRPWNDFSPAHVRDLTIAFRSVAELGDLARYALGYQRR